MTLSVIKSMNFLHSPQFILRWDNSGINMFNMCNLYTSQLQFVNCNPRPWRKSWQNYDGSWRISQRWVPKDVSSYFNDRTNSYHQIGLHSVVQLMKNTESSPDFSHLTLLRLGGHHGPPATNFALMPEEKMLHIWIFGTLTFKPSDMLSPILEALY